MINLKLTSNKKLVAWNQNLIKKHENTIVKKNNNQCCIIVIAHCNEKYHYLKNGTLAVSKFRCLIFYYFYQKWHQPECMWWDFEVNFNFIFSLLCWWAWWMNWTYRKEVSTSREHLLTRLNDPGYFLEQFDKTFYWENLTRKGFTRRL